MTGSVQNTSGATDADSRTIGVAVLGMGNVGAEVVRIITDNADDLRARVGAPVEIRGVAVRDLGRPRKIAQDLHEILAKQYEKEQQSYDP